MNNISFGSPINNDKTKDNKESKVNFINVNNYFNPQINIIKVNKLNENNKKSTKKNKKDNKSKLVEKNSYIDKNKDIKKYDTEKLKYIQLWWKEIYKIIKIQKNIRGFIYRNKLLEFLEKEEKIMLNIFFLYKTINRILIKNAIKKIRKYTFNLKSNNKNINNNSMNKKILKEKDNKKMGIKKLTISNYIAKRENTSKILYNENLQPQYFKKVRKYNNLKTLENISFKNSKNKSKKKTNLNKNNDILPKIRELVKKKYYHLHNKSIIGNMSTNVKIFNNIEPFDFVNYYNNKEKFIINSENNKDSTKINKKIIVKSRNIESNNAYLSSNLNKNNKNIIKENNLLSCLTCRKNNKKYIKINNNNKNNESVKPKRINKKRFNFNNNNNLIINNNTNDKIKNISNKKKLLIKKNRTKNYSLIIDPKKKQEINIIKYYLLLWKEITEKSFIIKYLIKYKLEKTKFVFFPIKKYMPSKTRQKLINNKLQNLINSIHNKGLGLLIKKILNKCTLYKYFLLFNHYTDKIKIFKKLQLYLRFKSKFKYNSKIINQYLDNRFDKKDNFFNIMPKRKKPKKKNVNNKNNSKIPLSSSYVSINKNELAYNLNEEKEKYFNSSNRNIQICQKIKINRCIYNNLFKKDNSKNKIKPKKIKPNLISLDTNLTMQINQLKMIFNLLELHNKRKKSLNYYFNKWKNYMKEKYYNTCYSYRLKNRYFPVYIYNRINNITYSTRNTVTHFFSPFKRKIRNYSYKEVIAITNSKDNINIINNSNNNYPSNIRITLNNSNITTNKNDSINLIYRKKFLGNRTSRNNTSNDYSSLLEYKKSINNDLLKDENSFNCLRLSQNLLNPHHQTIDNSSGDKYYSKMNKIEEREIFFNRGIKANNQYNISSYSNKNINDDFAINSYYKNIPRKKRITFRRFNSKRHFTIIDIIGKEFVIKKIKRINKSFDDYKKRYYFYVLGSISINRKKTI